MKFDDGKDYFDLPSWEATEHLNKEAKRILELLLERDGLNPTPALVAQVTEHLLNRFGNTDDLDWYLAATLTRGKFVENLIPPREYTTKIYPHLNGGLAKMTEVKTFAHSVLATEQLLDVGYLIDGNFYNRDYKIADLDSLVSHLGPEAMIFVKRDSSRFGRNSYLVRLEDFVNAPHETEPDWVIQRVQNPAPQLAAVGGTRPATIRIITVRDAEGYVDSPTASLLIGGERIELRESEPAIEVLITGKDGRLDSLGFDQHLMRYESAGGALPKFEDVTVEHFDTARQFVINLHRRYPKFDILQWDITIDETGTPWIYEWSGDHVDIGLSQLRGAIVLTGLRYFAQRINAPYFKDSAKWDEQEDGPDVIHFDQ